MLMMTHLGADGGAPPAAAPADTTSFMDMATRVSEAERRLYKEYNKIVLISQKFGGVPPQALDRYQDARQAVVDAALPWVTAHNNTPGVTPKSPTLPPSFSEAGLQGLGRVQTLIPANRVAVTFQDKTTTLGEAPFISLQNYGQSGLGIEPVTMICIIVGILVTGAVIALVISVWKRAEVETYRAQAARALERTRALDTCATITDSALRKQCVVAVEEAGVEQERAARPGFGMLQVLGLLALAGGVVAGVIYYRKYRRMRSSALIPAMAGSRR